MTYAWLSHIWRMKKIFIICKIYWWFVQVVGDWNTWLQKLNLRHEEYERERERDILCVIYIGSLCMSFVYVPKNILCIFIIYDIYFHMTYAWLSHIWRMKKIFIICKIFWWFVYVVGDWNTWLQKLDLRHKEYEREREREIFCVIYWWFVHVICDWMHDFKTHVNFRRMRVNQLCVIYLIFKIDFFI